MNDTQFEVDRDNLEVRITRVFNATPDKLWAAYTKPELIVKWWDNTEVDKNDLKVGGAWRYVSHGGDGSVHAFRGEFKEIEEPKKIVRTFEYEPMAGHVMTETLNLEPVGDGKTKVTTISKFDNAQDLEGMVSMGMKEGSSAGLDRLATVVENI